MSESALADGPYRSHRSYRTYLVLHGLVTVLVLGVFQFLVWQKEALLARGETVLLRLAPVDPRSLMQGDYMQLDYEVSRSISTLAREDEPGRAVIALDESKVATFVRIDDGSPLRGGEHWLKYRPREFGRVRLGAESYFFQEGEAPRFAKAKYGELKLAGNGSSVLVGLRDEERRPIPARNPNSHSATP